uniref:Reverse transcriptase domain-containing protein n=1 Tax=Monodelphis domestica TaxID=13616 RepID=A0A5F8HEG2_MONDO
MQGRSCPPRETCPCQTDPQVQNSTRGLFPLREVPEIGRNGDVVTLRHRIPFTPQEINEFTRNISTYEQDPFLVTKKMGDIFFQYNPSYKDVENLLQAFLSEREKNKIIAHVNKTRGHNAAHLPSQDPEWDYNNPEDYLQLYRCREVILMAMKECADSIDKWMELEKIKQKEEETPSRFMDRIIEFGERYLDWDLTKENSLRQVRRIFVNNSCKAIKNYFRTQFPRWSDMDLEELRKTAIYVLKGNKEKEEENYDDMDLRAVNNHVIKRHSVVSNINTIIFSIPSTATYFTVVDLCSAFFSIPIHENSRDIFPFTWKGCEYCWSLLPQGFVDSPSLFEQILSQDTDNIKFKNSKLIKYVDDLLLASTDAETCQEDSKHLLLELHKIGHKISKDKVQWCLPKVEYLGFILSAGAHLISPKRIENIQNLSAPTTKKQLRAILGAAGFCRQWIPCYGEVTKLLIAVTRDPVPEPLKLEPEHLSALSDLKKGYPVCPCSRNPRLQQAIYFVCT